MVMGMYPLPSYVQLLNVSLYLQLSFTHTYMRGLNNNRSVVSAPHKVVYTSRYVRYLGTSPPQDHVDPK